MKDCFNAFRKNVSSLLSDEDKDNLENKIEDAYYDAITRHNFLKVFKKNSNSIFKDVKTNESLREYHFYRKLQIKNDMLKHIGKFIKLKNATKEGLLSYISGTQKTIEGAKDSFELYDKTLESEIKDGFKLKLQNEGLLDLWNTKEHEQEIVEAKRMGKHESKRFNKIGQILNDHYKMISNLYKRHGVFIKDLEDRLFTNYHDVNELLKTSDSLSERIKHRRLPLQDQREISFNRWYNFIKNLIDVKKTFGKEASKKTFDLEKKMRNIYKTLTNRLDPIDDNRNVIEILNAPRVLRWKSPLANILYNRKMGAGTLHQAVDQDFSRAAKHIATLSRFGLNPNKMLESVINSVEKVYPELENTFNKQGLYDSMKGTLDMARGNLTDPHTKAAIIGGNIRAALNILKLGKVLLVSLPDLSNIAVENKRIYGSFLKSSYNSLVNIYNGIKLKDRPVFGDLLKSLTLSEIGNLVRWSSSPEMKIGLMSKLESLSFKLNGLYFWDKSNKVGNSIALSRHLAMNADTDFDGMIYRDKKFGERNVDILKQYHITGDDWDLIRKQPLVMEDNKKYLLPESANKISDSDIKDLLNKEGVTRITKRKIDERRQQIKLKFNAYFMDRADHYILKPSARDKYLLFLGTSSGQAKGQLMRFIAQYKMYGTTFISKTWGGQVYGFGAKSFWDAMYKGQSDRMGMVQLITYGALLGYLGLAADNFSQGISMPDPTNRDTLLKSFANSNSLGLFADMVLSNHTGFRNSSLFNLAGPAIGEATQALDLATSPLTGTFSTNSLFHFIKGNINPLNTFYTKYILDYLIFNRMQEAITPNYFSKKIRELHKKNEHYILPPAPGVTIR